MALRKISEKNTYLIKTDERIDRKFIKLGKKDPKQVEVLYKQLIKIGNNPHHFKPLRGKMKNCRRVHVDKSFVLLYEIDEKRRVVKILDYAHHDEVYT